MEAWLLNVVVRNFSANRMYALGIHVKTEASDLPKPTGTVSRQMWNCIFFIPLRTPLAWASNNIFEICEAGVLLFLVKGYETVRTLN